MRYRPHPSTVRAQYIELSRTAAFKRWRKRQWLRQFSLCVYCLRPTPYDDTHVDHCRAVAVGGSNSKLNLLIACSTCNLEKSAQVLTRPYEYLVRTRLLPLFILYELWAFLVLLVTATYTTPKI